MDVARFSPEGALAVVLLDFQADVEGEQVAVRGQGRGLLGRQQRLLGRAPEGRGEAVQYPAHLRDRGGERRELETYFMDLLQPPLAVKGINTHFRKS